MISRVSIWFETHTSQTWRWDFKEFLRGPRVDRSWAKFDGCVFRLSLTNGQELQSSRFHSGMGVTLTIAPLLRLALPSFAVQRRKRSSMRQRLTCLLAVFALAVSLHAQPT